VTHYENQILRPAVIDALSTQPDVLVHVAPIEVLSQSGRKRSVSELGAGTPDLLVSIQWQSGGIVGAQWIGLELKRPALPAGPTCTKCCRACLGRRTSLCCKAKVLELDAYQPAGRLDPEQIKLHEAWRKAGRWVYVVHTPAEALAILCVAREMLRIAGLTVLDECAEGPGLVTGRM